MLSPLRWIALLALSLLSVAPTQAAPNALRFYGYGRDDADRVKIPLVNAQSASLPVNVGQDFTLEFWIKARAADNPAPLIAGGENDSWVNGNVLLDRDVFGNGDAGDYGVSLVGGRRLAFGVNNGTTSRTLVSAGELPENLWAHVALTRRASDGRMEIFINGTSQGVAATGPAGNIAYNPNRTTSWANDPFLVLGAEKHDYDQQTNQNPPQYPSFRGWLDELRLSTTLRYAANFTPPAAPFSPDASTAALYHLDEGAGNAIGDALGTSNGARNVGGAPIAGPAWTNDTPFNQTSVTGQIALEDSISAGTAQLITFAFRPVGGGDAILRTFLALPVSFYFISDLPPDQYSVQIKGRKYLAKTVTIDTRTGSAFAPNVSLAGGDIIENNAVDFNDFIWLRLFFGTTATSPNWNPNADLNNDNLVDNSDFAILRRNFGRRGDP